MRAAPAVILLVVLALRPASAQHGTIDAHEALFTVLAAINAAGYDAELDSPTNHPLRKQVRDYILSRNLPSVERLKQFFSEHETGNWTSELSQYISFALVVDGPPDFEFLALTYQLPPDVQRLEGLGPLLSDFYREADIAGLYQKIQPAVEEIAASRQQEIIGSLFELNGYLRNPTSGVAGRSFQIVISLLGAPNQIHSRSYASNYYVILTPSVESQIEDVRYTYLHYVLELAVSRAQVELERVRPLGDYALGAPHLPEHYKQDFRLLATTSLIKAIEARLSKVPEGDRRAMVDEAYRRGYILTPAFYEELPAYEKQAEAMRLHFKTMLNEISLEKEEARAQNLEFDQVRQVRKVKPAAIPEPVLSKARQNLEEADNLYRERNLEGAREIYLRVLRETAEEGTSATAYYGLARIAALQNDPELSLSLFERALQSSPKPRERAWILVYLGRLSDLSGEADKAAEYYQDALAVESASEKAKETARQGASGAFRRAREP